MKRKQKNKGGASPSKERPPLQAMNVTQAKYIEALEEYPMVIVTGPAGTGKTFIASTMAADMLTDGEIGSVILTRPNVGMSKSLGLFPGTPEEKLAHWTIPFTDVLSARLGHVYLDHVRAGRIRTVPFETMAGRTFDNAAIILDEAQNTTPWEMKMFLTRIGNDSLVVVNGDIAQSAIKGDSGLAVAQHLASHNKMDVAQVQFGLDDIVRSDLCAQWVKAFYHYGI